MGALSRYISLIAVFSLAIFYSVYSVFKLLLGWAKYCGRFWTAKPRHSPPACLQDPLFRHGQAKLQSGLSLHYVETGERHRPLMLCLHGFPEFWYSWRHQLREFSTEYWVVAVDLRGYGDSDKPEGHEHYAVKELTEDIRKLLDALGRPKVTALLAHDWGGVIGWRFVSKYPEMVDKFFPMNCPHPSAFMRNITGSWKQFTKSWYMFMFLMPYLPELLFRINDMKFFDAMFRSRVSKKLVIHPDDLEAFKFIYSRPGAMRGPLSYIRCMMRSVELGARGPAASGSSKISVPTCMIWGTADLFLETSAGQESGKACERFEFHPVDGASHWVQQEDPDQVNAIIRDFMEEHLD